MLIGIGGEFESGKSTVAAKMVVNYNFTEKSFARNLKDMCGLVCGLTAWQMDTTEGKKTPLETPIVFSMEHIEAILDWHKLHNSYIPLKVHYREKMKDHIGKVLKTPREVLQFIGTEICRDCMNLFYHIMVVEYEIGNEGLIDVVVSDARFENERKWIKEKGGYTLLTYNPHAERVAASAHQSENVGGTDKYDFTIINDKTLGLRVLDKAVHTVMHMMDVPHAQHNYFKA